MIHPTTFGDEYIESSSKPVRAEPSRLVQFRQMKDTDKMPFGPFRDKPIGEVPARYLDRLRDANWLSNYPAVADYIQRNANAIDEELDEAETARSY